MAKTKANRAKPSPPPPFLGEKPTPERMAQASLASLKRSSAAASPGFLSGWLA